MNRLTGANFNTPNARAFTPTGVSPTSDHLDVDHFTPDPIGSEGGLLRLRGPAVLAASADLPGPITGILEIMRLIRKGREEDLPEIAAIQNASPEAAQWSPVDYLRYQFEVCVEQNRIAGFAAWRQAARGEFELLNLAVAPALRRRGVARKLLESMIERAKTGGPCSVFLEVRASNSAARAFYKCLKFEELHVRPNYYEYPLESAIVMKFQSC